MNTETIQKFIQLQALSNLSASSSNQSSNNDTSSIFNTMFNEELQSLLSNDQNGQNSNNIINVQQPALSYGNPFLTNDLNMDISNTYPVEKTGLSPNKNTNGKVTQYDDIIQEMSQKYDVDANLIKAIIQHESNFNPNAVSQAGAKGLMQLMPVNLKEYGVSNPFDPKQNIEAGTREIKRYLTMYDNNLPLSLAAYNAGMGNVRKYGGIPPFKETQDYVKKVSQTYLEA
jgi:soluble lytic murein transglycosylase-like protein